VTFSKAPIAVRCAVVTASFSLAAPHAFGADKTRRRRPGHS
jgi:hypothetical protein